MAYIRENDKLCTLCGDEGKISDNIHDRCICEINDKVPDKNGAETNLQTEITKNIQPEYLTHETVVKLVETILTTQSRLEREEEEIYRRKTREEVAHPEVIEREQIPLESCSGLNEVISKELRDRVQYAVKADFRMGFRPFQRSVLLKLMDGFEPEDSRGVPGEELAPGVEINLYGDEVEFEFICERRVVHYLDTGAAKYVELGWDDLSCLATIAFLALPDNRLDVTYQAMIRVISKLLPFIPGEIELTAYDDIVEKCNCILSFEDPKLMKRRILLTGPPGCGKSMIAKRVADVHPDYLRCSLTRTEDWIPWISLISKIVAKCDRKVLLVIDEIDELGISRDSDDGDVYELLRLLDGVDSTRNVTIIATTNRIKDLDEALLRPGRFYPILKVDMPDERQRSAILEYYARRYNATIDVESVMNTVHGNFTGADIRAAVEDCLIMGEVITTEAITKNLESLREAKSTT